MVLQGLGVWLSGERSIDSIHETISRIYLADGLNLIDADTRPFAKYPVYSRSFNHIEFPLGQIHRVQLSPDKFMEFRRSWDLIPHRPVRGD